MSYWQFPNNVVLGGRITNDLTLREVGNGGAKILEFSIANNLKSTGEDANSRTDKGHFFRCEAWGKTAEILQSLFKKGDPIIVIGTLNWNSWQDKDSGAKKESIKLRVETFHFVGSKSDKSDNGNGNVVYRNNGEEPQARVYAKPVDAFDRKPVAVPPPVFETDDSDIPF